MSRQEEGLKTEIILASASPRRRDIFSSLGLDFKVVEPKRCREKVEGDPVNMAVANSILKVEEAAVAVRGGKVRYLVSGFDTIVYRGKSIFGKPRDTEEAYSFIEALSGKTHSVVTGICIRDSVTGKQLTGSEVSRVSFKDLEPLEIEEYLSREYVLDKAGAYNISGPGALLVKKLKGCLFNVIGVPVFKYISLLEEFDYNIL